MLKDSETFDSSLIEEEQAAAEIEKKETATKKTRMKTRDKRISYVS